MKINIRYILPIALLVSCVSSRQSLTVEPKNTVLPVVSMELLSQSKRICFDENPYPYVSLKNNAGNIIKSNKALQYGIAPKMLERGESLSYDIDLDVPFNLMSNFEGILILELPLFNCSDWDGKFTGDVSLSSNNYISTLHYEVPVSYARGASDN